MAANQWGDRDPFFKPGKFGLTRLGQIELGTAPRCIVEDLIPRDGLTLVWGPPKCGKTFWCFDLVGHVALGRSYCGRDVEQGVVVYIGCEGEHGLCTRAVAFRQARINSSEDPPLFLIMTPLDLVTEIDALITDIRGHLGEEIPITIVVDTLNRSLHGSESKDEDMSAYVRAADQLRTAFHCAVILIHHCGVAGDRPRGHTSLTGAIDAQIAIQKDADGTVLATVEMMKDGPSGDMMRCRLEVVNLGIDDRDKPITSCVVEHLGSAAGGGSKKARKLSATQKLALRMLNEAITIAGEEPPACHHIPAGALCVKEALWREYCYDGGISSGSTRQAKHAACSRAIDTLLGDGFVGCWGDWYWPVSSTS